MPLFKESKDKGKATALPLEQNFLLSNVKSQLAYLAAVGFIQPQTLTLINDALANDQSRSNAAEVSESLGPKNKAVRDYMSFSICTKMTADESVASEFVGFFHLR